MRKIYLAFVPVFIMVSVLLVSCIQSGTVPKISPGEEAFVLHCRVCHATGGNVLNPAKTLHHNALAKNGIMTAVDIVAKMRNPGPKMTKFDESTIPDKTAHAIADYILEAFK